MWRSAFSDYIFGNLTGRTCDDEGDCVDGDSAELAELIYEQRDATYWGAEAKATVNLFEGAKGELQGVALADYVRASLEGGGEVPRIPPYHVGVGLDWDGTRIGAGVLVKYTGARDEHLGHGRDGDLRLRVARCAGALASIREESRHRDITRGTQPDRSAAA